MPDIIRRKTPTVQIGTISIGSQHPIAIQSMTNTPTADTKATLDQIKQLIKAGSEMVRITINDDVAAESAIKIIKTLRKEGTVTPIIGDFHFIGHRILKKYPDLAGLLDKYRINPGNVGQKTDDSDPFAQIIGIAKDNNKPVRIGVNSGSLDPIVLNAHFEKNPNDSPQAIIRTSMIKSALDSAERAMALGLPKNKIVLSVKMSSLDGMVAVNETLADQCDYVLHLGLTEAGSGLEGLISSSAALSILLKKGIGDTIRISLTPEPNTQRTQEVHACQTLLQTLGIRQFAPRVISCPGCGRAEGNRFISLAADIKSFIHDNIGKWKKQYPGIETMTVAVMGCIVNGPGESKHADIGISLPGKGEGVNATVYIHGKKATMLKNQNFVKDFKELMLKFITETYR